MVFVCCLGIMGPAISDYNMRLIICSVIQLNGRHCIMKVLNDSQLKFFSGNLPFQRCFVGRWRVHHAEGDAGNRDGHLQNGRLRHEDAWGRIDAGEEVSISPIQLQQQPEKLDPITNKINQLVVLKRSSFLRGVVTNLNCWIQDGQDLPANGQKFGRKIVFGRVQRGR